MVAVALGKFFLKNNDLKCAQFVLQGTKSMNRSIGASESTVDAVVEGDISLDLR